MVWAQALAGALLLAAMSPVPSALGAALLGTAVWLWWRDQVPADAPFWLRHAAAFALLAEIAICLGWFAFMHQEGWLFAPADGSRHLAEVATLAVIASAALARWALDVRQDRDLALWAALALGALAGAVELYGLRFGGSAPLAALRLAHLGLGLAGLLAVRGAGRLALTLGVMAWIGVAGVWSILQLAMWLA